MDVVGMDGAHPTLSTCWGMEAPVLMLGLVLLLLRLRLHLRVLSSLECRSPGRELLRRRPSRSLLPSSEGSPDDYSW